MAGDVIPLRPVTDRLTKDKAEERIRAVTLDSGGVGYTDHVTGQMNERDISMRQVWEVLRGGLVFQDPEWSVEHEDWVCKLRKTVAGRRVTVVVALEGNNKMTVVTTYG